MICDFLLLIFRFCFASGAPDNIKIWKFPDGNFLQNFSGHQAIVNTVAINSDSVLVSGGELNTQWLMVVLGVAESNGLCEIMPLCGIITRCCF